jgi:predicted ATPase
MERQGHPRYEESGQDRAVISRSFYPPHHPHITAFREEVSRWRFYYLEPTAMRNEVPLRDVGSLDTPGHQIAAFFNTVKVANPRQLAAHAKALKAVIPRFGGLDVQRTDQGRVRLVAEENGREVSANLLSEGTLRVLGLLAILNPVEPVSVVGYEEPENGVHPRRLQLVADMLLRAARKGSPQLIVNTHSPLIPEYLYGQENVALVVCARDADDYSYYCDFEDFAQGDGGLFVHQDVGIALDPDSSSLGERLVRGDFGG